MQHLRHPLVYLKQRAQQIPTTIHLPIALGLAVVFSLFMTVVSVTIYMTNGSAKLDLSRPGFERQRAQVVATEPPATYDTTSPITTSTIDDFLKEYDTRAHNLSQYGDFRDQPLSDTVLQINDN